MKVFYTVKFSPICCFFNLHKEKVGFSGQIFSVCSKKNWVPQRVYTTFCSTANRTF